ncbi:MAG: hypothetical protein H6Q15_1526 [Bacteroidetes bacterium]|nr:hypothetical protein [Bacteroidota bacterium]
MKSFHSKNYSLILAILFMFAGFEQSYSQIGDGTNFNFSMGDYTYWKGYQSKNISTPTTISFTNWVLYPNPSSCTWNGNQPAPAAGDTCFIINKNYYEYDVNVGATKLIKIPTYFGFNRSTTINVEKGGSNSNMLSYDMLVSENNSMVTFNYAMVLQAPGHTGYENPLFQIEIIELDQNDNEIGRLDPTTYFEVLGKTPAPDGWSLFSGGIWQNWKQIGMNLSDFRSKRIRMKVTVAGCTLGGHWSYGYFVGKVAPSECIVTSCYNADTVAKLIAPSGFAKYEWFANPNDLPLSQLSTIATGTPLAESHIVGVVPAKNTFLVKNNTLANYGDNYFVRLTSQMTSGSTTPGYVSYIKVKALNTKPKVGFIPSQEIEGEELVKFTNTTTFPVQDTTALIEYFWDFGDGSDILYYNSQTNPIEANINPSHLYIEGGRYKVILTAKYNGCGSTYDTIVVGLEDIDYDVSLSLYPNPAYKQTTIKMNGVNEAVNIIVIDEQAREIKKMKVSPSNGAIETKLDLSKFTPGLYYIKVIGEKIQKTEKLIVN